MKNFGVYISLTILLTGCGTLQPKNYAEPTTGQSAVLTIANESNARLRVWHMANADNCSETSYVNGNSGIAEQTTLKLKYAAGKRIAFYITGLRENNFSKSQCFFIFSTNLAPDGRYVLAYSGTEETCQLRQGKFEADGALVSEKFVVQRVYTAGGELFGWCKSDR